MHINKQLYARQATLVRCLEKVTQRRETHTGLLTDVETLADKNVETGPLWARERHVQTQIHPRRGVDHWASPMYLAHGLCWKG